MPGGLADTQPWSVICPGWFAVTTIVIVAEAPGFSEPRLQRTIGLPLQLPWLAFAETSVALPGSRSWNATVPAAPFPEFETVAV